MNSKFRTLSQKARERIRRGLLRSWQPGGTHREMQRARGLRSSAETERRRAAWDARGRLEFHVTLPDGPEYRIRRALHGRSDQYDVVDSTDGRTISTASAPRTMRFLIGLAAVYRNEIS